MLAFFSDFLTVRRIDDIFDTFGGSIIYEVASVSTLSIPNLNLEGKP